MPHQDDVQAEVRRSHRDVGERGLDHAKLGLRAHVHAADTRNHARRPSGRNVPAIGWAAFGVRDINGACGFFSSIPSLYTVFLGLV